MANEERNALEELVERLDYDIGLVHTCAGVMNFSDSVCQDIIKAHRIIAELAKVKWWRSISGWIPRGSDVSKILVECRAIAEEGEYNGNE